MNQEEMLNGRNSCSKRDKDATFFRKNEGRLQTSQLKVAFNIQIGTENQFVVGFSIHQETCDTSYIIPHMKKYKKT